VIEDCARRLKVFRMLLEIRRRPEMLELMWRHVNADMPHHGIRDLLTDGGLALANTLLCNEEIAIHVGAYDIDVFGTCPRNSCFSIGTFVL
jgi:hypothetical protein